LITIFQFEQVQKKKSAFLVEIHTALLIESARTKEQKILRVLVDQRHAPKIEETSKRNILTGFVAKNRVITNPSSVRIQNFQGRQFSSSTIPQPLLLNFHNS